MTDERLPIVEAREQIGRLVDAAHFGGDATVITKNGEPRAVIVSYEWYREAETRRAALVAGAAGAGAGAEPGLQAASASTIRHGRRRGGHPGLPGETARDSTAQHD